MNDHILAAAQSLQAEIGNSFTMEQLEARTNISRATIYRRIGGKKKLLERLALEQGETFKDIGSKERIFNAARTVFSREGLAAATMEQIAKEAGVGIATVYRQFGDKESLVRAFIKENTPRAIVYELALNPTEDIVTDLESIVRSVLPYFYKNREVLRLVFMGSEAERRYLQTLRQGSDSTLIRISSYFQAQINAGRLHTASQPNELALALLGIILAFALIGPLHYGTTLDNSEKSSQKIVQLFLNDLRGDQT